MSQQIKQKPDQINIIFLYTRLADYFYQCIVHLVNEHNINAHIVCKSPDINAPYKFADNKKIRIINDTEFKSTLYLWSWIKSVSPNAIYISGWNNLKYLIIAIYYSKKIPTIIGLDNPWIGSFKQYILSGIGNITISHMFSHCWVAGPPQYVYAKKYIKKIR